MRVLCRKCFEPMQKVTNSLIKCKCGESYNVNSRVAIFDILLETGYVHKNVTLNDIKNGIKKGNIMPTEYIAAINGPWISIYDTEFIGLFSPKWLKKYQNNTNSIVLYNYKKLNSTILTLLLLSFFVNIILLTLLYLMQ